MLTTSLQEIYATYALEKEPYWLAGYNEWREIKSAFNVIRPNKEKFSLTEVLEKKGLRIALLCFRGVDGFNKEKQDYPLWCFRQIRHLIGNEKYLEVLDRAVTQNWNYDTAKCLRESMGNNVFSFGASLKIKPFAIFYSQLKHHRFFDHQWYEAHGKWWEVCGVEKQVLALLDDCIQDALGEYLSLEERQLVETRYKLRFNAKKLSAFETKTKYQERYGSRDDFRKVNIHNETLQVRGNLSFLIELAGDSSKSSPFLAQSRISNVGIDSEYWQLRLGLCISILYSTMPMSKYSFTAFAHAVELTQKISGYNPNLIEAQTQKLRSIFALS
jgi:hypothetical protein